MADRASIEALESIIIETFELTLEIREVNRESNFYVCGGDSLSALELLSHLSSRLNVDINMPEFPLWSTVSAIAEFLREAIPQPGDELYLGPEPGQRPVLRRRPCQCQRDDKCLPRLPIACPRVSNIFGKEYDSGQRATLAALR